MIVVCVSSSAHVLVLWSSLNAYSTLTFQEGMVRISSIFIVNFIDVIDVNCPINIQNVRQTKEIRSRQKH